MKKLFAIMLMLAMMVSCIAIAEEAATEVWASDDTPTGYYVTFRYSNPDANRVRLFGQWLFTTELENSRYKTVQHTPEEWENGMFPECGASFEYREMAKNEDGVWECTVPLPHGLYNYCFYVDGVEGADLTDTTDALRISDPSNKPIVYLDETSHLYSQIYVPFVEELHGMSPTCTFLDPTVATQKGTVEYVFFAGDEGVEDPAVVYTPYGFDANREEPYKMLLLNHGSGDTETGWFNHAWASVILDNAIEAGLTEPIVVVATNNNYMTTQDEIIEYLLPFMQENYNVSTAVEDLAVAGLSMGGGFTADIMFTYPDAFDYYGVWSMGNFPEEISEETLEILRGKTIYCSAGDTDFALPRHEEMISKLAENGVTYLSNLYPGGHQWTVWREQLHTMLTEVLWK